MPSFLAICWRYVWHYPYIWRILVFQLRAKVVSSLVFRSTWLASWGLLFLSIVYSPIYAMGIPSQLIIPTDCVLHLCCWYQRAWSFRTRSWEQYEVIGFWLLVISGTGNVSLTTVYQREIGTVLVTAACLGFLDPICGIIPPSSLYWVIV